MHQADSLGLAHVVARLEAYGERMGATFSISPLLKRLAAEGKHFTR